MKGKLGIQLDNITCLDACEVWVDDTSDDYVQVEGFSKMVSVEVFGPVNKEEQVIIDFSSIKKVLKSFVDDPVVGFDHKLLVNNEVILAPSVELNFVQSKKGTRQLIEIRNPHRDFEMAFRAKGDSSFLRIYTGKLQDAISNYLTRSVRELYECEDLCIVAHLSGNVPTSDTKYRGKFNYIHGLAHSTSWGCENIIHGHSSWVQAINDLGEVDVQVTDHIAEYLDGNYLVNDEYVKDNRYRYDFSPVKIKYTSDCRGKWSLVIPSHHLLPLGAEPTIENIVSHLVEVWEDELKENNIVKLIVSEGLTKAGVWYAPSQS